MKPSATRWVRRQTSFWAGAAKKATLSMRPVAPRRQPQMAIGSRQHRESALPGATCPPAVVGCHPTPAAVGWSLRGTMRAASMRHGKAAQGHPRQQGPAAPRLQRWSGHFGLLRNLGSLLWLFHYEWQAACHPVPPEWVLGSPTLAVWRKRTQGRALF